MELLRLNKNDNLLEDTYKTIGKSGEGLVVEKRSKFISFAHNASSPEEAMEIVAGYKAKYRDARHVCYAYAIGPGREVYRLGDDGEPSGTAGRPIFGAISSAGLTDVVVVVVRYFGGILLGTGGLIVAYKAAAAQAIEGSVAEERVVEERLQYDFTYPMINKVMRVVREMSARVVSQDFGTACSVTLAVRRSMAGELRRRLEALSFA